MDGPRNKMEQTPKSDHIEHLSNGDNPIVELAEDFYGFSNSDKQVICNGQDCYSTLKLLITEIDKLCQKMNNYDSIIQSPKNIRLIGEGNSSNSFTGNDFDEQHGESPKLCTNFNFSSRSSITSCNSSIEEDMKRPLKKRVIKNLPPSEKKINIKNIPISYPATPMMSIALLEEPESSYLSHISKILPKFQNKNRFRTPAELKELPPLADYVLTSPLYGQILDNFDSKSRGDLATQSQCISAMEECVCGCAFESSEH